MNKLQFDEESHTYTLNDRVVPGVTSVLEVLNDFRAVDADMWDRAATFGTHVHKAIALKLDGQLDEANLDPWLKPYVDAAFQCMFDLRLEPSAWEKRIYHAGYGYAGTLDLVAVRTARTRQRWLVADWKTGTTMPKLVGPQTAAYKRALDPTADQHYDRMGILLCPFSGHGYKVTRLTDDRDWHIFVSALNCYRWRESM